MKVFLCALMLSVVTTGFAQSMNLIVSARNESITVSADDENDNKLLLLKPVTINNAADYLTIKVFKEQNKSTWKRNFYIYDEQDQVIAELKLMKENEYCVNLKDVLPKLERNKLYAVYSFVIPQDQTKAMAVKILRLLVCKLKLSE